MVDFPKARDVMSSEVTTVPADMPVRALCRLLAERGISAVLVTDATGAVLGIVTEADLLRRLAGAEDRPMTWLSTLFRSLDRLASFYTRTHGRIAADVMTRHVVSVTSEASPAHCAHLMEEKGIKRLPVIEDGRLIGVVSRVDLLRAAAETSDRTNNDGVGDAAIQAALRREIRKEPWATVNYICPAVRGGVVTLYGTASSETVRRAMVLLVQRIEGVTRVEDRLSLVTPLPIIGI